MKVCVFGVGYVGLVTGVCLSAIGHDVVCVDVNAERVRKTNAGKSPIFEPGLDRLLHDALAKKTFAATTDAAAALVGSDVSIIAVGTPARNGEIDLSYVEQGATTIGGYLAGSSRRHTVVVKSTVVPGTTGTLVRHALERASGKKAGRDFGLAMNPEFLREGCAVSDFMDPDRIVIGEIDRASGDVLVELYARFDCPKVRVATVNAELIKYASNALLSTLISFSNELYRVCERTEGADGEAMMDGLALDKRLSPILDGVRVSPAILTYLRGGIGYGGSCFPKDVTALRAHAQSLGVSMPILSAVMDVNRARPSEIVDILERELGGITGKTVAVMGLAFKPDTDDLRESPAIGLIEALLRRSASVRGYDPEAADGARALFGDRVAVVEGAGALFAGADAAVLATSWSEFRDWDYATLVPTMRTPLVLDGRNALRRVQWPTGTRYVRVGTGAVGRS